jgi:hypothetical protein
MSADADVTDPVHLPGGASRETWPFTAKADRQRRGMAVRIEPDGTRNDIGLLEQICFSPYAPAGFTSYLDGAQE